MVEPIPGGDRLMTESLVMYQVMVPVSAPGKVGSKVGWCLTWTWKGYSAEATWLATRHSTGNGGEPLEQNGSTRTWCWRDLTNWPSGPTYRVPGSHQRPPKPTGATNHQFILLHTPCTSPNTTLFRQSWQRHPGRPRKPQPRHPL